MSSMPPPAGNGSNPDRQTGTVKPPTSQSRAMEAWTLWDRVKEALHKVWTAIVKAIP